MSNASEETEAVPERSSPDVTSKRRVMSKTPMFTAMHAARYSRQDMIKEIDQIEGTSLICYVGGDRTEIERDDTLRFVDLLHNIGPGEPIDLMIHTGGGDVDACEKLIQLLRANLGEARLRAIVPEMAKSAGTIMAIAADEILMSSSSELGMIDPQIAMKDSQGNWFSHSVIEYLRAFDYYSGLLSGDARNTLAERMLLDFDAKIVAKFRGIEARTRIFAEGLLKRNNSLNYTSIVSELLNSERWHTHGQPIGSEDAAVLGLPIISIPMNDPRWQRYWGLYCLQRQQVGHDRKIFESCYVSQVVHCPSSNDGAGD